MLRSAARRRRSPARTGRRAVHRTALDLLGRHVVQRAEELPGGGQPGGRLTERRRSARSRPGRRGRACPWSGLSSRSMFAGLTSRWTQARAWRGVQRGGHLGDDLGGPPRRQRALRSSSERMSPPRTKRMAMNSTPRPRPPRNRDDVRVIHAGRGPRFPDEALAEGLVLGQVRGQDLQRDIAVQPGVVGTVDDGHAPRPICSASWYRRDERARGEVTRTAARFLAHSSSTRFPPRSPAARRCSAGQGAAASPVHKIAGRPVIHPSDRPIIQCGVPPATPSNPAWYRHRRSGLLHLHHAA